MPPFKIWTISDFESSGGPESKSPSVRPAAVAASSNCNSAKPHDFSSSSSNQPLSFQCCHIPTLPNAQHAETLLQRVVREFQPIVTRRNYNVLSISEMCCCNDGLDFQPTAAGAKRRKRRIMSHNIWGYNQTTFGRNRNNSHTIHVRLRHPTDHARLLSYEDVAGTLAHEISHCEHSQHNAKFYKLMDDILDEHAGLLASQLRTNGTPMAAFTGPGTALGSSSFHGTGNRLGGGGSVATHPNNVPRHSSSNNDDDDDSKIRGRTLGGDPTFVSWMTPAEAAVAAAEARRRQQHLRLRGEHCCRPCTINISDDEDEDDDEKIDDESIKESKHDRPIAAAEISIVVKRRMDAAPADDKKKKRPGDNAVKEKRFQTNSLNAADSSECIDLTLGEDEDQKPAATNRASATRLAWQEWACHQCTFHNRPLALACDMCSAVRNSHLLL